MEKESLGLRARRDQRIGRRRRLRRRKKFFLYGLILAAALAVIFLCTIPLIKDRKEPEIIGRDMVYKSLALSQASKEEIVGSTENLNADSSDWEVRYENWLYQKGLMDPSLKSQMEEAGGRYFTYGEFSYILEQLGIPREETFVTFTVGDRTYSSEKYFKEENYKAENLVPAQVWWDFYDRFLWSSETVSGNGIWDSLKDNGIHEEKLYVYGTPDTMASLAPWQMKTNRGDYGFEGLSMDACLDQKIRVLVRDQEVIRLLEVSSDPVVYENIWITRSSQEGITVYMDGIYREFSIKGADGSSNTLADLTLQGGVPEKLELKKDSIRGKVLEVGEDYIEVEKYGKVPLDPAFKAYKVYETVEEQSLNDIVVGYDLQQFVVADGMICASLTTHALETTSIRVLLHNSDFTSVYHQTVELSSDVPLTVSTMNQSKEYAPGEVILFTPDSQEFEDGRITITSESYAGKITINSLERSYGTPYYRGSIELEKRDEGILIVNELLLEDYLCRVVPSEMPVSYGMEALKVQAICARSYACNQIRENKCSQYGAHVDDSTNYQVYNNTPEYDEANEAVQATYGQVIQNGDEIITAYYYSTSCGHTTDAGIWGSDPALIPYIQSKFVTATDPGLDLTNEENFRSWILTPSQTAFDSSYGWYRWKVSATEEEVSQSVNGKLADMQKRYPELILVQESDGSFVQKEISDLGTIKDIQVTKRGAGGICEEIVLVGSKASVKLVRQTVIRNLLGNESFTIEKQDGTTSQKAGLPSAFFFVETGENQEGEKTFTFQGGGFGHGAGMSQNGASGMAAAGYDYQEIISFFYPGTTLHKLYS